MAKKRKFYDPVVAVSILTVAFTILKEIGKALIGFITYKLLRKWWGKEK